MRTETLRGVRMRGRLARMARVATYAACVSTVLGVVTARRVRAEVAETSRATAAAIADLPELEGGITRLVVNGESVHVSAAVVPGSVDDLARKIERTCRADVEGLPGATPDRKRLSIADALLDASRSISTHDGSTTRVVCLADTDETRHRSLTERLTAFANSHDLASAGSLRQFMLTPVATGTRVIAVWLPSRFPIDTAFPETGDAPGSDAVAAPRPEQSRRLLTASAEGHSHVVRVYEMVNAGLSATEALLRYEAALARAGWFPHRQEGRTPGATTFAFGERDLFVQVRADARSGNVFVSTVETGLETRAPSTEH
jgi:hypothetical protein